MCDIFVRIKRYVMIALISSVLISCQSTSVQTSNYNNNINNIPDYLDGEFIGFQQQIIETKEQVFAIDDDMKQLVSDKILPLRDNKKRAQKLLKLIFSKDNIDLAYQNSANLTASQAYHLKTANCMSLTIMTYALAREAQLDVKFQQVEVPEYWVRNGEYNMLTGHVNLVITEPRLPTKTLVWGRELLQIDFDPAIYRKLFPKKIISKDTVLAMFYNNKGADAIVKRNYLQAYAYIKKSTEVDPYFSSAWGNLGILYKLTNHHDNALKAYEFAIALDSDNLTSLNNLALLFKAQGQIEKAQHIENVIHKKREANPYYQALLADEAFFHGDNDLALSHYKKAIKMNNRVHEFYFGLAKVYYALKELDKAERAMEKAIAYNKGSLIESQYIAKLNFLRQADIHD